MGNCIQPFRIEIPQVPSLPGYAFSTPAMKALAPLAADLQAFFGPLQ